MANKKEMMVLGGAAVGIASYYLYGKVKPKEESGKNNANPANAQSKLKDSHVNTEDSTKESKFIESGKSGLPVDQKLKDSKIEGKMVKGTLPEIKSRSEGEDVISKKKSA